MILQIKRNKFFGRGYIFKKIIIDKKTPWYTEYRYAELPWLVSVEWTKKGRKAKEKFEEEFLKWIYTPEIITISEPDWWE